MTLRNNPADKTTRILLEQTIGEFVRASDLIGTLDDTIYTIGSERSGNIGAHIRHNFDFANNFISGLADGRMDYSIRERDLRLEQDRHFAIKRLDELIDRLRHIPSEQIASPIIVRSEINAALWYPSSGGRELEFLNSHTVHHHAMIAEKLTAQGIEPPAGFGISRSTLKFWDEIGRQVPTNQLRYMPLKSTLPKFIG